MKFSKALKRIGKIFALLFIMCILCISLFYFRFAYLRRPRAISETVICPVVTNTVLNLDAKIVLRHYYYYHDYTQSEGAGWFLILENDKNEQFIQVIPHHRRGLSDEDMELMKLDLSWDNQYKLTIKSLRWPGIVWDAYFISNCLRIPDEMGAVMVSNLDQPHVPLSEKVLDNLEPLDLNKDILDEMKLVDLSDYNIEANQVLINEDPNVLLYINGDYKLSSLSILTVGPVLNGGDCYLSTIASSQWVLFIDSSFLADKIYANQIFLNNGKRGLSKTSKKRLKAMGIEPIILSEKKESNQLE